MTQEELQREEDLNIKLTPAIEDAFYFLNHLDNDNGEILKDINNDDESFEEYEARLSAKYDPPQHAAERLQQYSAEEIRGAVRCAYRMIDNIKKYGVACKEWEQ